MAKTKVENFKKDTQSRSWTLCFHNIENTGFDTARISEILQSIPSIVYFCLAMEKGLESGKLHIHCYFHTRNPVKFSTLINNKFIGADLKIEESQGTAQENRDYVFKIGKWEHDPKSDQRIPDAQVEWGLLPISKKGHRSDFERLYSLIQEGLSNAEILAINPDYMQFLNHIDRVRQTLREEEFHNKWRDISCIYVFGETNTNKTRTYMEQYGYENVYRITNYTGNAVWDGYRGQDVVIFEEYRSQILISEMLTWLEGYPNCSLRARYNDKVACYTHVVIISNIPLTEQYPNVQEDSPATWRAFLRRIQKVIHHINQTEIITYNSVNEYLNRNEFVPVTQPTPFDNDKTKPESMPFD